MASLTDQIAKAQADTDRSKREAATMKATVARVQREAEKLRAQLNLIEQIEEAQRPERPDWTLPKKKKGVDYHATLTLHITDTHFDEIVDPHQISGLNAFNREIAEIRLRRCMEKAIWLARHYLSGVKYDGVAVLAGGDIFSGNIHEELQRTNEGTLFEALLHWLGPMGAFLGGLADEFGKVYFAGTPGNHGRMTRKPIAKQRAQDNLDWLFYRLLARDFARDPRFTFNIPTSADTRVQIYNTRYLLEHGDAYKGGSGIAGALSPLMLGSHRMARREMAASHPYDFQVLGHWHQELWLPGKGLLVGPCLKGYDEYAYIGKFEPDKQGAKQAFWLTTPEHGITANTPILVQDRKSEGW